MRRPRRFQIFDFRFQIERLLAAEIAEKARKGREDWGHQRRKKMSDEVDFPVYVLARDCGEVTAYPSLEVMKGYFEAIDVEKNEYEAWDANGFPVMLTVLDVNSGWLKITKNSDSAIVEEKLMELKAIAKQYRGPQGLLRSLKNRLHGR